MASNRRQPLISCSPWALLIVLAFSALFLGWRLATPFLQRPHDPEAVARAIQARGDLAADELATIELFRQASPSVVHIRTTETVSVRDRWRLTPMEVPQGSGSGFVWDERGYIVTNYHVIRGANRAFVFLEGASAQHEARYVGGDPDYDIAVLKIDVPGPELRALAVGISKDLLVGQKVFAIGNPFGLDHTLTTGIISGLGREITSVSNQPILDVIQTDAAINPGNSGGPLLDSAGRLIGMNTAIATPPGVTAGVGFNVGIGFAVPVDTINKVVPGLIRTGRYAPPRLGIVSAPEPVAEALGVEGVVVQSVEPGSGAESAGLRSLVRNSGGIVECDVITAADGRAVANLAELREVLCDRKPGESVPVEFLRGGRKLETRITLK